MNRIKRLRLSIPLWNMPSDPVKAIWWFFHWLLQVLVRFFWLPILIMAIYEAYSNGLVGGIFNGLVSGIVTVFVGLFVWAVLYGVLIVVNVTTGISRAVSDVKRMQQQQNDFLHQTYAPFMGGGSGPAREDRVVEGTITDLDEERQRRRRE
ncbi:hypothetical protein KDA_34540 [Dictyobacter alpinus]|uniref:DUF4282 domain-containing protein n=1 Tax=Dictyobacter alpinus TaxID=2014873 RepID=A0A402B9H5_9CHLR|nr:hypothetical protein [Dictyobacter alpinus]GCE27970.1 hypothetical protein KDA_34540 [Dictyobacter alpinus]